MSTTNSGTVLRPMRGFSLIEVMVAVVILATGLLALAALQGSLSRASADAKARGRVAAMLTARMEDLRLQSGGLTEGDAPEETSTTDPCGDGDTTDWLDCTRAEANLGSLTVNQNVTTWSGSGTFTATTTTDPDMAQFRRITLTANWTDAANSGHTLTTRTDVSALSLVTSLVQQPDDSESGGSNPIVRQDSPATAGVIPVALGNGDSSASSNPKPELVGRNNNQTIVGTRFNVLTYTPETGDAARIQKRFENDIIKCTCQYGAGGNNLPEIYRTPQWPAIWTGERYDVYDPDSSADAPGQTLAAPAGPASGVEQSELCQECCRDHHDTSATGVAKFDPERVSTSGESNGREKYNPNGSGTLVLANTTNGTYINSCRLIRVDGFWRTAADMYSRQFGLLETQPVSSVRAKSGLPTTAATTAYTQFIKDYVRGYQTTTASSGNAPAGAQALFDETGRGLNATTVPIAAPSNSDYRYVHARGLYIDYLEEDARQRIVDILADTGDTGACPTGGPNAVSDVSECILPYLPFTTINMTEIATWLASDENVLTVNSGNLLATDPAQPSGGRTVGTSVGTANNTGSARNSNSGVAFSEVVEGGVDPLDASGESSDAQEFEVGGTVNAGPTFNVRVTGGGTNPFVFFTLGTDLNVECTKPASGDHRCVTANGTVLPQAGTVRVSHYWTEATTSQSVTTAVCDGTNATDTIAVPTFRNYAVTTATIGATNGTISPPVDDNTMAEYTDIAFGAIAANNVVQLTLAEETGSPTSATISSCTTNGGHNKIQNVLWNKPWCPIVAGNPLSGCRS